MPARLAKRRAARKRVIVRPMSDRFVTIRRCGNPMEAEQLAALLRDEGIPTSLPGNTHNAMYGGLLAAALEVPIQVPERDAERAKAILGALEEYEAVEPNLDARTAPDDEEMTEGEGPFRSTRLEAPVSDRKPGVAIAAAIVLPMVLGAFGAGHFYARSYLRGFVLLLLAWTLVFVGLGGTGAAFLGLPVVVALDVAGALSILRAAQQPG